MKTLAALFVLVGFVTGCRAQELEGNWKLKELKCKSGKPLHKQIIQEVNGQKVPVTIALDGSLLVKPATVEVKSRITQMFPSGETRECTVTDVKAFTVIESELSMTTVSSYEQCAGQTEARPLEADKKETRSQYGVSGNTLTIINSPLEQDALCDKGDSMISVFERGK